jgi:CRP-like cAMP-binding protein
VCDADEAEVTRLGPGDHFGELGLLTGAASPAKITALTPSSVYELTQEELAPILVAWPEVSQELDRVVGRRQSVGRQIRGDTVQPRPAKQSLPWFAGWFPRRA